MNVPFPEPADRVESRAEVFLGYLDYFRSVVIEKLQGLPDEELRTSRLPSGWAPIELLQHLIHVERRWLVWGFEGEPVADPWGDQPSGRWSVAADETLSGLVDALHQQATRSRAIVQAHQLTDVGQPGERWGGMPPASLERVLFHLLQEYARHAGHLDIVREMIDGEVGYGRG